MDQVFGVLTALVAAFGPLAIGVTKLVDGARNLFDKADTAPKWTWNVLAFAIAIAACVLFQINVLAPIVAMVPRFSDATLNESLGQVLTGIGVAGMASFWHEHMSATSAKSP